MSLDTFQDFKDCSFCVAMLNSLGARFSTPRMKRETLQVSRLLGFTEHSRPSTPLLRNLSISRRHSALSPRRKARSAFHSAHSAPLDHSASRSTFDSPLRSFDISRSLGVSRHPRRPDQISKSSRHPRHSTQITASQPHPIHLYARMRKLSLDDTRALDNSPRL